MVTYEQIGIASAAFIAVVIVVAVGIYIARSNKINGFWNDGDGLSITDMLALSVVGGYSLILILFGYKLVKGSLSINDISFLGQAIIPVTTVLGGYFIDRTARNFSKKNSPGSTSSEVNNDARV
ncbi:hypothetical protein [Brevibacillus centrosporus]|uniref:hypothetical protein n=1 Tax=Brevibacillus centrosporus TaxID=54910 RepID=UPI002E23B0DD|nr:hypothetical protein [Brevibacillus centrosporus]